MLTLNSIKFNANVIHIGIIILTIKMLLINFMGIILINILNHTLWIEL